VGLTLYYSQGSQVAEDEKLMVYLGEPGDKPGSFYLNLIIFCSMRVNPSKGGEAKPWTWRCELAQPR
jgi:hypothetical protein